MGGSSYAQHAFDDEILSDDEDLEEAERSRAEELGHKRNREDDYSPDFADEQDEGYTSRQKAEGDETDDLVFAQDYSRGSSG